MKKTTKLVFMSLVTIALCISLIAGATFALFTSDDSVNIAVSSGKVKVTAEAKNLTVYTTDQNDEDNEEARVNKWLEGSEAKLVDGQNVKLDNMTPGAGVSFTIDVTNDSDVAIKYLIQLTQKDTNEEESAYSLIDVLNVSVDGATLEKNGNALSTKWIDVVANGEIGALTVDMYLPWSVNNYYQGLSCELTVALYAVQGNGNYSVYVSDAASLQAALNSGNGFPIVLASDIDVDYGFTVTTPGNVVDLNGYSITAHEDANGACVAFKVSGVDAELTIKDSVGTSKVTAHNDTKYYAIAVWAYDGAQVKIYGGTFSNNWEDDLIYASSPENASTKSARIEIYGGTYYSVRGTDNQGGMQPTCVRLLNVRNGDHQKPYPGQIEVYGGTFYDFIVTNPDDWSQFNVNGKNWLADGYKAVVTQGTHPVYDYGTIDIYTVVKAD